MYAIKTEGLTKNYKKVTAVNNLNLAVENGELFSLLGVNGAGKTTAIKLLTGLSRVSGGDAFVNGNSVVSNTRAVKSIIGVSPQETAVAHNLSVKENLELLCGIYGFPKQKALSKIEELSDIFDLTSVLYKKAGKLSGGWQRRLSIALALVGEPQVLFLDEPTLGLDVIARSELWDTLRKLKGRMTIILTTHYMEEAEALSDRVGIMKDGNLLMLGTVEEIKEKAGKEKFEDAFVAIIKGAK